MEKLPGWLQSIIKYFSSSISKKIITPYALLTLVLATMGVFVITRFVTSSFEERLKTQLRESAQIVSDEIVNRERIRLELERVVANTIGVANALVDRDVAVLNELIAPVIANAKIVDSIIIVDTQGKEVLRLQRESLGTDVFVKTQTNSGLDLSGWEAVNTVLANPDGFKQIQLAQDPELNQLIIYTVGPIKRDDGTVGAALVGTYLESEVAILKDLALAQLTLFDDTGQIIATTFLLNEDERAKSFDVFTGQRYTQVIEALEVTLLDEIEIPDVEIRNQTYRLAYAPFILRNQTFGVYAVALPTNFITEAPGKSRNWLIAIFSIGVVLVFGLGYLVSIRITRPILRLVRTSEAISAGDLDQRTGLDREDELGILATAFDDMTTDLQRLLQIQKEEASKLNAILNSIADGVVVQDADGEILIANPAAERILEEIDQNFLDPAKQNVENVVSEQPNTKDQLSLLLSRMTGLEFHEAQRFDIDRQVVSALAAPVVTPDGDRLGSVVVLRDITREVESERLKDEFITSISHELKTPLTAIKGYNTLLKMMLQMNPGDEMTQRQTSIVETMEKEVTDLDDIIQAMLDLSQIDAGELGVDQAPVNLSELVQSESEDWLSKMEERNLTFNLDLPENPIWVEGDQNRLTRVLHNLIKNAHDYTLPSGKVEILVSQQNGHSQVDIKDTGVGIRKEDQHFLFTKFFRAIHEESHFGEISGAGLGLYTSKAIIDAHNGKMWMESEPNRGSVISFTLPVIDPEDDDWDDF